MIHRFLYGPPNYLVTKFSAEDRRMFAFWVIVVSGFGAMLFGTKVLYASIISWFGLIPGFTSETPVEEEK